MLALPPDILSFLLPFSTLFSAPVWKNALVLILGAILAKGKRTVTSALRYMGHKNEANFPKYHWVLSHAKWSSLNAAKILLGLLVKLIPNKMVTLVIDETLERRKGKKIKANGKYRDAVRSTQTKAVTCFGLKWLTLTILIKFSWSNRRWALPFMTILEPSEKCDKASNRKHKSSIKWSIQALKQVKRWLSGYSITVLGDGGFATALFCWECIKLNVSLVSRLRIDARLYDFPAERLPGSKGRPAKKGTRLMSFKEMVEIEDAGWVEAVICGYEGKSTKVQYLTNTALWHVEGFEPAPIRWVLVVDPTGKRGPIPLFSTDVNLSAQCIIELYVERWSIEVTFEEVRAHLGVETQRQWSDGAIARTTPALMGLFSLTCLMANSMLQGKELEKGGAAWYRKDQGTYSDVLTLIRKELWRWKSLNGFAEKGVNGEKADRGMVDWLIDMLGSAA